MRRRRSHPTLAEPPDTPLETRSPPPLRVVGLEQGGLEARVRSEPLRLAFRPVADLRRGMAVGHEVLVGIGDAPPRAPGAWSQEGHAVQAGAVEAHLVRAALRARAALPAGCFLLVGVSGRALLAATLRGAFEDAGRLDGIVVAVTDEAAPGEAAAARSALQALRERGARLAVDDTGVGYASLAQLVALRPEYVRIGAMFTAEVDRQHAQAAVIEAIAVVASRIGALLIAAEVPSRAELRAIRRLGVPLAQGPALGPDLPAMGELGAEARAAIAAGELPSPPALPVDGSVEPVAPLAAGATLEAMADRFLEDPRHDFLVLLDPDGTPVALVERAALLRGEAYEHEPMVVGPALCLRELARRMAARPPFDRLVPAVCCDEEGGYLGIVRVERVLDALAAA